MTTVNEFIAHLQAYVATSPEKGGAEVLLRVDDEFCLLFGQAKTAIGITPGQLCLIFEPDTRGPRIHLREMSIQ